MKSFEITGPIHTSASFGEESTHPLTEEDIFNLTLNNGLSLDSNASGPFGNF